MRPLVATIDLAAIRHNYAVAKRCAPGRQAFAVVKANAYGHGVREVVSALHEEADGFAVASLEEAAEVRAMHGEARILLLEGQPDMRPDPFTPGNSVEEMLRKDLDTEYSVRKHLKAAIALCESHHDYVSRDLLLAQLRDTEEDHAYWLEKQIGLIDKMGLQNYLQSQS